MKKILLYGLIGFVALIASTFGEELGQAISEVILGNPPTKVVSSTGFTELHKEAHIKGCVQAGSNETYCICTFNEIKDVMSPSDMTRITKDYQATKQLPQIMIDAMQKCEYLKAQ